MNASFDPFGWSTHTELLGVWGMRGTRPSYKCTTGRIGSSSNGPANRANSIVVLAFCAPYHYRLDWNIWFLGFPPHQSMLRQREGWMMELVQKLLQPQAQLRPWLYLLDQTSAELLRSNFYDHHRAPLAAKVDMYHYQMNKPLWGLMTDWIRGRKIVWWKRHYHESLVPTVVWNSRSSRLQMVSIDEL